MNEVNKTLYIPLYGKAKVSKRMCFSFFYGKIQVEKQNRRNLIF